MRTGKECWEAARVVTYVNSAYEMDLEDVYTFALSCQHASNVNYAHYAEGTPEEQIAVVVYNGDVSREELDAGWSWACATGEV